MAINPSIALSFQAPRIEDPLNKLAQIEQLKAYRQNALIKEREAALAEKALQSENALRNLYSSGKPVSFEQAYALGGTKGAEVAMAQAKSDEAAARRKSAERKAILDTVNVGRTSLAAVPDDAASYGKWRQEFTSQYPEMSPFFPGEESYVPAAEGGMGTKRQLLLTADQLAKDENALSRLNLQLDAQRKLQQERLESQEGISQRALESQEARTAATLRSQEDRADAALALQKQQLGRQAMLDSPEYKQKVARAQAFGKSLAENEVAAKAELPKIIQNAEIGLDLIDQLVGKEAVEKNGKVVTPATEPHPGFSGLVGATVYPFPGTRFIPGTDTASADALFDQILGGAFLEAFETLKGGGQITVEEGKKATAARTRMSIAQSEKEFIKAAREYQGIVKGAVERARAKAGAATQSGSTGMGEEINFEDLQ